MEPFEDILNDNFDGYDPTDDESMHLSDSDLRHEDEGKLIAKCEIRRGDVICKRGGHNTFDESHQEFLDQKDRYCQAYKGTSVRSEKHRYRNTLIQWVYGRDGRFLKPVHNQVGMYRVMTLEEVLPKVSQTLREDRKKGSNCTKVGLHKKRSKCGKVARTGGSPPTVQPVVLFRPNDGSVGVATCKNDDSVDNLDAVDLLEEHPKQNDDHTYIDDFFNWYVKEWRSDYHASDISDATLDDDSIPLEQNDDYEPIDMFNMAEEKWDRHNDTPSINTGVAIAGTFYRGSGTITTTAYPNHQIHDCEPLDLSNMTEEKWESLMVSLSTCTTCFV